MNNPATRCFLIGAVAIGMTALSAQATPGPDVKLLRVPEGGLQPQAIVDAKGTLHLVYLLGAPDACDVMYCMKTSGQTGFSTPIRVNSISGSAIAIGTVRGAQFALGRGGRIHVVWNGSDRAPKGPAGGSPMLYSRQLENGGRFEPERNLMTATTHLDGGGSVAADSEGRVYVVWHGHRVTGPQEEIDRAVFMSCSTDDGQNFMAERQVNPPETGACGCCGLKAFAGKQGTLAILYRSATAIGNRDAELLLSTNFGQSFRAQVAGSWHVSTCPMSTFALGNGPGGLQAMWEAQGQIYFASGVSGSPDLLAPVQAEGIAGKRKHPAFAIALDGSSSRIIAWTEGTGWEKGGDLAWECLDGKGQVTSSGRAPGVPVWGYAAAVAGPAGDFTLIY